MTITSINRNGLLPPGCVDGFCTTCKREAVVSETDPRCPYCKRALDPRSLPSAPGDVRTVAQAVQSGADVAAAPVEPVRALPARNGAVAAPPAIKTVTLPATKEARAWDRATDQLVAAAEADEARAKAEYDRAKARYQELRQATHLIRQLRQLARVDGAPEAATTPAPSGEGKRWARGFDACINCQTTRIKHAAKGRCMTCASHFQRTGEERPIREALNHE